MGDYKRGILIHPEDFDREWLGLMSDAGLNRLGLHPVGGAEARDSLENAIAGHNLPESRLLRREAAARGISVEYEAHAMSWLLPRSLFARVPEWFRVNESGVRTPDFNLCVSNAEALAYVAERAGLLASLLDTGESRYFYWLDDVSSGACHCPDCKKLSAADQQLRAVNAMLTGLRRYRPDAKLCYIAYHATMDVPRNVQPLDGVFLEYAPMRRDHHRPINDPTCPENARETAPLKELISFFGKKDARVLEYWMDNSMFSGWKKPPKPFALDEEVMKRDVDFYASMGFETITSFGCYLGADYRKLYGTPPTAAYGAILRGDATP